MTTNQIRALELQETKRANQENERLAKAKLPADYISSVGSILRGVGAFKPSAKPMSQISKYLKDESGRRIGTFTYHVD